MAPDPQDGEAGRQRMPLGGRSVSALIPNALTICALCSGLTAVRFAFVDRWDEVLEIRSRDNDAPIADQLVRAA